MFASISYQLAVVQFLVFLVDVVLVDIMRKNPDCLQIYPKSSTVRLQSIWLEKLTWSINFVNIVMNFINCFELASIQYAKWDTY